MSTDSWDLILRPKTGWFDINIRDIYRYRDLIGMFVKRDLIAQYKQTILGPLWFIIQPLLSTVVFTIIFGRIAKISTDGLPQFLFYLSGTVAWGYFAACLTGTSNTFVSNASIFGKVYFPRLCMPAATVITNIAMFAIQLAFFIVIYLYFIIKGTPIHPTIWICALPLILFQMALLGLGFGILTSSLTTKYRDLTFLVSFGVSLWMYATPVVYPLSRVPEKYQLIFNLNPMTSVIEIFRLAFLGTGTITGRMLLLSWAITFGVLLIGIVLFSRVEKTFMDTV